MSDAGERARARVRASSLGIAAIAAAKGLFHALTVGSYGRQWNEYYFLDLSRAPSAGYVDVTPLTPTLYAAAGLGGESLLALRLPAIVTGTAAVVVAGLLARALGGRLFAQCLAAAAVALATCYVRVTGFHAITSHEPLFWVLAAYLVVLIADHGRARMWLALGVVLALGLLNKPTMGLFAAGLGVALAVLRPLRRELRRPWLYLGAAAGLVLLTPTVIWQAANDFPILSFLAAKRRQVEGASMVAFLLAPAIFLLPASLPIWLTGLVELARRATPGRKALAIVFVLSLVTLAISGSKTYYLLPAFTLLLPAGAVAIERWRPWLRWTAAGAVVVNGVAWLPIAVPISSDEAYPERVMPSLLWRHPALGRAAAVEPTIPPAHGFCEVVGALHARLSRTAPSVMLLGHDYQVTAVVNACPAGFGLPAVISADVHYAMRRPRTDWGARVLALNFSDRELAPLFASCRVLHDEALRVTECARPKVPLQSAWPALTSYSHFAEDSASRARDRYWKARAP